VVDLFYDRVLNDPALAPFFEGVHMAKLKNHQVGSVMIRASWPWSS
jgi:truncated hemoglobin YjbI